MIVQVRFMTSSPVGLKRNWRNHSRQPAMRHATTETSARAPLAPVSSGYADVNGIKLYHEIYGQGEPLVLLHGGLMTIDEMSTLLEPFAKTHNVIAVELQGHGRTADTDRPFRSRPWATTLPRCSTR